jgi:hypothetical protein
MAKIAPTHAHLVAEHQDIIFSSIEDSDMSIRMRALELLTAMVRHKFYSLGYNLSLSLGNPAQYPIDCSATPRPLNQTTHPACPISLFRSSRNVGFWICNHPSYHINRNCTIQISNRSISSGCCAPDSSDDKSRRVFGGSGF